MTTSSISPVPISLTLIICLRTIPAPFVPLFTSILKFLALNRECNARLFLRKMTDPSSLVAHASHDRQRTGSVGSGRGMERHSAWRRERLRWAFCSGVSLTFGCGCRTPPSRPDLWSPLRFFLEPARAAAATASVRARSRFFSRLLFLLERLGLLLADVASCGSIDVSFFSASSLSLVPSLPTSVIPSSESSTAVVDDDVVSSDSFPLSEEDRILLSHPPIPCGTFSFPFSGCCDDDGDGPLLLPCAPPPFLPFFPLN
mmetsp:Transcript_1478/g.2848  ORF Transcript_1478/g.2848 Transcript_1478/m.2848 type:complete len:258 (+) Transcript_1478:1676-2449(+)